MPAVVIDGIPPWDGSYQFDDWLFSNEQLYQIKEISKGLRAAELIEALDMNDSAAFVALAVVVLRMNGKQIADVDIADFWAAKVGAITIDLGPQGDVPPTLPPSSDELAGSGSSSGGGSGNGGESLPAAQQATGSRS